MPKLEMQPMPVITTRSRIGPATLPWGWDMVKRLTRRSALRVAGALAIAASFALSSAHGSAQPNNLFAEIYKRGLDKQREMRSIRARFTETTTSTLLVKPIVAH